MYANVCFPTAKANGKSSRRSTSRSTRERRSCSLRKIRSCPLNWTRYVIRSCAAYTSRKQTSPSQLFYSITSLFNNPADWILGQRQRLFYMLMQKSEFRNRRLFTVGPNSLIAFLSLLHFVRSQRHHCLVSLVKTPRILVLGRMEQLPGLLYGPLEM